MMFTSFQAVKGCMGDANLFREFSVRKAAPFFFQEGGELTVQISSHVTSVAKIA